MKVTITDDEIRCEIGDDEQPLDRAKMIDWSCRIATHEACAWAIKRLGEEMEKSVAFYRTGEAVDQIVSN